MITMRPDQQSVYDDVRAAVARYQSVLVQCPTGWGKTALATVIAAGAAKKRKRAIFSVHRRQLLKQTSVTFDMVGLPHAFIAAGHSANPFAQVQIASIDTLRNRLDRWPADLLVVDEGHLAAAPTWLKVIDHYKEQGTKILVLSATPQRLDGKPLGKVADHMVLGPSVAWCIQKGILSDYRAFAPARPDMSSLHVRGGEYINAELDELFEEPKVTGDAIRSWRQFANGKRTIVFCYSRERAKRLCEAANQAGIGAVYIDGETKDRETPIRAFADGKAKWLVNVDICTAGFDLSAQVGRDVPIEAGIFMRPTNSLSLARQMIGRVLRRKPEPAIIIDMVNLLAQHGLPEQEPEWSLEGSDTRKKSGERVIATMTCEKCYACQPPSVKCRYCSHVREVDGRTVTEEEGELAEIDVRALREHYQAIDAEHNRRAERRAEGMAKTLPELAALAKQRGFQAGWVAHKLKARGVPFRFGDIVREMQ